MEAKPEYSGEMWTRRNQSIMCPTIGFMRREPVEIEERSVILLEARDRVAEGLDGKRDVFTTGRFCLHRDRYRTEPESENGHAMVRYLRRSLRRSQFANRFEIGRVTYRLSFIRRRRWALSRWRKTRELKSCEIYLWTKRERCRRREAKTPP